MALDTYALTTLANLKSVLGITDSTSDSALEDTINRASAIVEQVLGYTVRSRTEAEWHDLDGSRTIRLQAPVLAIASLGVGLVDGLFVRVTDSTLIEAQLSVTTSGVELVTTASTGTSTTTSLDFADYPTMATMAAAIVTAAVGVTAEAMRTGRSYMLRPCGGVSVMSGSFIAMASPDQAASYAVDRKTGTVTVSPGFSGFPEDIDPDGYWRTGVMGTVGPVMVYANYTHGYTTVPYDIEQAALTVSTAIWNQRGTDLTLQSETLGSYSYSRGSGTASSLRMVAEEALASRSKIR